MFLKSNNELIPLFGDLEKLTTKPIEVFPITAEDYIDTYQMFWNKSTSHNYIVELFGERFILPSSSYIVVSDEGSLPDMMLVEEVIGRNIPILGVSNGYRQLVHDIPKVVNVIDDKEVYIPTGNHLVPIFSHTGNKLILIGTNNRLVGDMVSGCFIV